MSDDYILIPINSTIPEGTDFCLTLDNDLMEPLIPRGERVYISRSQGPEEFEVGIFLYKGQIYCRQYCVDYAGNMHLLCANPARESENLCLNRKEQEKCQCLGKVLLKSKPPMPIYF